MAVGSNSGRGHVVKNAKENINRYGLIVWTLLCLISLLVYTFTHTSTLMGRYASPGVGQIAAFGIESSIIGMSIRIGRIMRQLVERPKERALWLSLFWQGGTLLFVLLVTASAQIVEGFEVRHKQPFSVEAVALLDPVLIAVGLLATGVIPALVIALTEIVSGEIRETINGSKAVATPVVALAPIAAPALPNLLPSLQESAADSIPTRDEVADEQPVALEQETVATSPSTQEHSSIKGAVFAYLDSHPTAKIAELLDAFPGVARGSLSGNLSTWKAEQAKKQEMVTSANGRHS